MSLSKQTQLRMPKIKEGILRGLNYDEIAATCKLRNHRTIERDVKTWVESGEFETWLKVEFLTTYPEIKAEDKGLAFQEIAKLVGKMLTRKIERKEQIELSQKVLHLHMWKPETVDPITSRQ
jgi:hypothetical protein